MGELFTYCLRCLGPPTRLLQRGSRHPSFEDPHLRIDPPFMYRATLPFSQVVLSHIHSLYTVPIGNINLVAIRL